MSEGDIVADLLRAGALRGEQGEVAPVHVPVVVEVGVNAGLTARRRRIAALRDLPLIVRRRCIS